MAATQGSSKSGSGWPQLGAWPASGPCPRHRLSRTHPAAGCLLPASRDRLVAALAGMGHRLNVSARRRRPFNVRDHSILMFARLMTSPKRSYDSFITRASSAGELETGSMPSTWKRSRTSLLWIAF